MEMEQQIKSIIKLVTELYHPEDVKVHNSKDNDRYFITFYFDDIDDKYVYSNTASLEPQSIKARVLRREIRKSIHDFFGIKTTGTQIGTHYPDYENHPITVDVSYTK